MANTTERRHFVNNAPQTTLTAGISNSDVSCVVSSLTGWPSSTPFLAVLEANTTNEEIVEVTAVVGTTLTVTRGQDGTAAVSHLSGATVDQGVVRRDFDEANAHTSATTGVHGVAGDVVGTTDTQTLTNKTLTSPAISNPAITGSGTISAASVATTGNIAAGGALTGTLKAARLISQINFNGTIPAGTTNGSAQMVSGVIDFDTLAAVGDDPSFPKSNVVIPTTGTYRVSGAVSSGATTSNTTFQKIGISKNDTNPTTFLYSSASAPVGGVNTTTTTWLIPKTFSLVAGDVLRLWVEWNSGGGGSIRANGNPDSFLLVERIS